MKAVSLIIVLALLAGCEKDNQWDCFTSYGEDMAETRNLEPFTEIYTDDKIDIIYRYSDSYSVDVHFGDKVIKHIETSVSNQSLKITNNAKCNWVRDLSKKPKVIVYAPAFSLLENHGVGDIVFEDTLHTEEFTYDQWHSNGSVVLILNVNLSRIIMNTGASDVLVTGFSDESRAYSSCSGKLDAAGLKSDVTLVNNSSIQDMKVHAGSYLFGKITKSGDIKYAGEPSAIDTDILGTGTVHPL